MITSQFLGLIQRHQALFLEQKSLNRSLFANSEGFRCDSRLKVTRRETYCDGLQLGFLKSFPENVSRKPVHQKNEMECS